MRDERRERERELRLFLKSLIFQMHSVLWEVYFSSLSEVQNSGWFFKKSYNQYKKPKKVIMWLLNYPTGCQKSMISLPWVSQHFQRATKWRQRSELGDCLGQSHKQMYATSENRFQHSSVSLKIQSAPQNQLNSHRHKSIINFTHQRSSREFSGVPGGWMALRRLKTEWPLAH